MKIISIEKLIFLCRIVIFLVLNLHGFRAHKNLKCFSRVFTCLYLDTFIKINLQHSQYNYLRPFVFTRTELKFYNSYT